MSDFSPQTCLPPSLRAILTTPPIIKVGVQVKKGLLDSAAAFSDSEVKAAAKSNPAPIIELGQQAKLKGVVTDASLSLHGLVGTVLKKSFTPPPLDLTMSWGPDDYTSRLHDQVDSIWQVYASLASQNSVGLCLSKCQEKTHGQLITLCHGDKPVAEGSLVWPHSQFIDAVNNDEGHQSHIKITPSCSLIQITKVLVPGAIHSIHAQCIEWIFKHSGQAVVTTSTLYTRRVIPPDNSSLPLFTTQEFATPMPPPPQSIFENLEYVPAPDPGDNVLADEVEVEFEDDFFDGQPDLVDVEPDSDSDADQDPNKVNFHI